MLTLPGPCPSFGGGGGRLPQSLGFFPPLCTHNSQLSAIQLGRETPQTGRYKQGIAAPSHGVLVFSSKQSSQNVLISFMFLLVSIFLLPKLYVALGKEAYLSPSLRTMADMCWQPKLSIEWDFFFPLKSLTVKEACLSGWARQSFQWAVEAEGWRLLIQVLVHRPARCSVIPPFRKSKCPVAIAHRTNLQSQ